MEIGKILSNSPNVIENILQHLGARDLCRCSRVCKLWKVMAAEELERRKKITWFYQGLKCFQHDAIHPEYAACSMNRAHKFEDGLCEQLTSLQMKPALCIAFATTSSLVHFEKMFRSHASASPRNKRLKKAKTEADNLNSDNMSNFNYRISHIPIAGRYTGLNHQEQENYAVLKNVLQKMLPSSCKVALYVGDNLASSRNICRLLETISAPAISGYLFPKMAESTLRFCKIDEPDIHARLTKKRKETLRDNIFHMIQSRDMSLKYILAPMHPQNFSFFQRDLEHRNFQGSHWEVSVQMGSNYALAFGPKVKVNSTHIDLLKLPQHRKSLRRRTTYGKTNQTIAFCFGNKKEFNSSNVYRQLSFSHLYPDLPIVGLFTNDVETRPFRFVTTTGEVIIENKVEMGGYFIVSFPV